MLLCLAKVLTTKHADPVTQPRSAGLKPLTSSHVSCFCFMMKKEAKMDEHVKNPSDKTPVLLY
ncbi:hypothetical protein ZOSMA_57G00240 [Zostera marina]|uniref:Uncharacterized protein n=1 Tax=Zostera marina TaxID=29655 RepID=A0A0K9NVA3_ZOSMR|nr:hypothetical protein ZOSMA_57G00240 [Zostera marina]